MSKLRYCDKCEAIVPKGCKFIKCCESEMVENQQRLNHVGDLCLECWKEINKKEARQ